MMNEKDFQKMLDGQSQRIERYIRTLIIDMEIVKSDVGELKEGMKKKVDYEEFVSLKSKFEKAIA